MTKVPYCFPRDPWPTALPGAQPKFAARLLQGRYVVGLTDVEREERYLMSADLLEQLTAHVRHNRTQQSTEPLESYLLRLEQMVRDQGGEVSPIEMTWVFQQLRTLHGLHAIDNP